MINTVLRWARAIASSDTTGVLLFGRCWGEFMILRSI
jgi:hypothetical protein